MNPLFDRLFACHAGRDDVFLRVPGSGFLSYGEFLDMVGRFANLLGAKGVRPGDRVAAQIEKSPAALALYGACVQSGAVFLPLNTAYTGEELDYFVADSGATLLVCDPDREQALAPIAAHHAVRLETLASSTCGSFAVEARALSATAPVADRSGGDLAALLYTSGTTGRSKGAMLTHDNLLSNAGTLSELWRFTKSDTLLHALPIFHTHGLFVATNVTLAAGAAMIFLPRFDLDALLREMPRSTVMMGVPTFYTRLLDRPDFDRDTAQGMRLFISGSAPLLADTHTAFETRTGHRILERYGMTETNMNTSNPYEGERRAGTVGMPLPGVDLRIADPSTGESLPPGDVGQIEVRGPNVFAGYWNMPEKTAEEIRSDGFFITGDLGKLDDAGYLHIVGRQKDLIISGGYNIYPKEIELLLDDQPGVLESAVVGVTDKDFGEAVIAYIVANPDETPDLAHVATACRKHLARYKHPREFLVLGELPRNTMGKVQKTVLRERYETLSRTTPVSRTRA